MPIHLDEMREAVERRALGRYSVSADSDFAFSEDSHNTPKLILRLRRLGRAAGHRTMLLVQAESNEQQLQASFGWAADIREQLPEPETADLYMIMMIDGVADEIAGRIETDDRFCRKIVLRSNETASDLLDRTFLGSVSKEVISSTISDPLQASLEALGKEYSWTTEYLPMWREIILSGRTGGDLGQALTAVMPDMEVDN